MIQSNELRSGNFIYKFGIDYIGDNPIVDRDDFEIIKVDIDVLKNIEDFNGTTDFYYTEPIPLTEEILLKCGFVQCENEFWYQKNIISISPSVGTYEIQGSKLSLSVMRENPIRYLHQLQNIYFALTNEELTFNNL